MLPQRGVRLMFFCQETQHIDLSKFYRQRCFYASVKYPGGFWIFRTMQSVILVYVHFYLPFTECMDGRFGWNCSTPCQKGFYGHLCRKSCECYAYFCDPVKGCNKSDLFSKSYTPNVKTLSHAHKGLQTKFGKWNCFCSQICAQIFYTFVPYVMTI